MITREVNSKDENLKVELFSFMDLVDINENKEVLIKRILEEIPKNKEIGFAGYDTKESLKLFLDWMIDKSEDLDNITEFKIEELVEKIQKVINKISKKIEKRKLNLFVFPSFNNFIHEKLGGVSGFCEWENEITLIINPNSNWKENFDFSFGHELAHSLSKFYKNEKSLGSWLIFEGIAEHFQKNEITGKKSAIVESITKEKAMEIFEEIKPHLNEETEELHRELFYGTGRYPLWAGYSIGYYLLEKYLKSHNLDVLDIIFKSSKEINV